MIWEFYVRKTVTKNKLVIVSVTKFHSTLRLKFLFTFLRGFGLDHLRKDTLFNLMTGYRVYGQ